MMGLSALEGKRGLSVDLVVEEVTIVGDGGAEGGGGGRL